MKRRNLSIAKVEKVELFSIITDFSLKQMTIMLYKVVQKLSYLQLIKY